MATDDFFRARLDQMIDLRRPLAVLANRMPWGQIEAALAPVFARSAAPESVAAPRPKVTAHIQAPARTRQYAPKRDRRRLRRYRGLLEHTAVVPLVGPWHPPVPVLPCRNAGVHIPRFHQRPGGAWRDRLPGLPAPWLFPPPLPATVCARRRDRRGPGTGPAHAPGSHHVP